MRIEFEPKEIFQNKTIPLDCGLVGYSALVEALKLRTPVRLPAAVSAKHIGGGKRQKAGFAVFDRRYHPGDSLIEHFVFALRHENIDLLVLKRAFEAVPASVPQEYVRSVPTGAYARRLWFLYEVLTGKMLDIEDAPKTTAIDLLDGERYFTGRAKISRRHKVNDNLLGNDDCCPVIRKTDKLAAFSAAKLADRAAELSSRAGARLLSRAASFLLLDDSRASFEIEGERAPRNRLERWGKAVLEY